MTVPRSRLRVVLNIISYKHHYLAITLDELFKHVLHFSLFASPPRGNGPEHLEAGLISSPSWSCVHSAGATPYSVSHPQVLLTTCFSAATTFYFPCLPRSLQKNLNPTRRHSFSCVLEKWTSSKKDNEMYFHVSRSRTVALCRQVRKLAWELVVPH